jgi:hypothetical protein
MSKGYWDNSRGAVSGNSTQPQTDDELDKIHIGVDITKVELSDIDWDLIKDNMKLVFTAKEIKAYTDRQVKEAEAKIRNTGEHGFIEMLMGRGVKFSEDFKSDTTLVRVPTESFRKYAQPKGDK